MHTEYFSRVPMRLVDPDEADMEYWTPEYYITHPTCGIFLPVVLDNVRMALPFEFSIAAMILASAEETRSNLSRLLSTSENWQLLRGSA
jgi:hypothetical protein